MKAMSKAPNYFAGKTIIITGDTANQAIGMRLRQSFAVCVNAGVPTLGLLAFPELWHVCHRHSRLPFQRHSLI
jgi:hypothetical protein